MRRQARCSRTSTRAPTTSTRLPPSARSRRAQRRSCPSTRLGCRPTWTRSSSSAERHGLEIVEDAACAIGATYKGRPIGSLGPLACFSLHPRKVITTGEGGMIAVHDPAVAEQLRRLRAHGMDTLRSRPPQRRGCGVRDLPRTRLQRPHDRHAGGARALPARRAGLRSSSVGAPARRALHGGDRADPLP